MISLRALVLETRTPRARSQESAIQRLWGVAVCRDCGTTIVLGETARDGLADRCASCRALPAASTATTIRVAATDIREVAATTSSRDGLPDAA